ncbi:MAG TPA: hypothetical protein VI564_08570 [Candidatus Nanoarchaeia archaeon]|nr:hypothetical protein [Candidatus Nanoarchaeia archaeon]
MDSSALEKIAQDLPVLDNTTIQMGRLSKFYSVHRAEITICEGDPGKPKSRLLYVYGVDDSRKWILCSASGVPIESNMYLDPVDHMPISMETIVEYIILQQQSI